MSLLALHGLMMLATSAASFLVQRSPPDSTTRSALAPAARMAGIAVAVWEVYQVWAWLTPRATNGVPSFSTSWVPETCRPGGRGGLGGRGDQRRRAERDDGGSQGGAGQQGPARPHGTSSFRGHRTTAAARRLERSWWSAPTRRSAGRPTGGCVVTQPGRRQRSPRAETLHTGVDCPPRGRGRRGRSEHTGRMTASRVLPRARARSPVRGAAPAGPRPGDRVADRPACWRCSACSRRRSTRSGSGWGSCATSSPTWWCTPPGPTLVLSSVVLLLTARGLRRGNRLAWLAHDRRAGGLRRSIHLAKGPDLLPAAGRRGRRSCGSPAQGKAFPVLPTRRAVRWAIIWLVAAVVFFVVLVVGLVVWVGRHRPVRRADRPARPGPGARHLRAGRGVRRRPALVAALAPPAAPAQPRRTTATSASGRGWWCSEHGGGTLDYFALRDDKDWFFTRLVGRGPLGARRRLPGLARPDRPARGTRRWPGRSSSTTPTTSAGRSPSSARPRTGCRDYESSGLRTVYLGDEAIVDCPTFTLEGRSHKSLRQAVNRVERAGLRDDVPRPVGDRPRAARADRGR